jgi:hypothetical protein
MNPLTGLLGSRRRPLRHIATEGDVPSAAHGRGDRAGYCLATEHARLCLLPWSPVLAKRAHWQQFALSRFAQLQGLDIEDWIVRVVDEPPPRARLAVAVPGSLLARLVAGACLAEVRIELLERLSALLARHPDFDGMVLEIGLRGATLVGLRDGAAIRLRQRSIEPPARPPAERSASIALSLVPTILAEQASGNLQKAPLLVAAPKLELQSLVAKSLRDAGIAADGWPC